MSRAYALVLLLAGTLPAGTVQALELTGRFAMLGGTAQAGEGDIGYLDQDHRLLSSDQQSLRLMLDEVLEQGDWSLHLKASRRQLNGYPLEAPHSSELFRYHRWADDWLAEEDSDSAIRIGYELDRLVYHHRFGDATLGLGRQPIDWGSGRFWQPLNVFGAFAPTDLDTDFKPGVDAVILDWYPSTFSSLTAAYVFSPEDHAELENSAALHYRRQVGTLSELSLLAGSVLGNRVAGAAFESAWRGMGWRVEGLHYRLEEEDEEALFWIAGLDYQFDNGNLLIAEWYDNSRGAGSRSTLAELSSDTLVVYGLQPQLGRQLLGLGLERDLTPLLHGGYTLLGATLEEEVSLLHQLNLRYSVSNESDLLFSLLLGSGPGLDEADSPHSEFGHLPASMTLRLRFYF